MITYFVALPFLSSEDGPVPGEAKEAPSEAAATRMARQMATTLEHCGAVAFSRSGDSSSGDFDDAKVLATFGKVGSVGEAAA